ncbi:MADS-box protein CMB1-like [Canna indica]|uniref:MADS-box protein CMB1-like n=1 Tax=Canna indica TaxID=4628 RepID=A0AAQ3Q735_9LILI|nr:MADS-box protein CMB1-like [Canna indica]
MGRGKVELKRIENKINRQVTFAKRRNGLLKKAYELSVLCDAEVAVIVFSGRGRLFEFCSSSSMIKTIERYQRCSYNADNLASPSEPQNTYQEYLKLKSRVEYLQGSQRNLLGEDLESLNIKELNQLEDQVEMSLKRIRSKKTQGIIDQLTDLKRKEQMLLESNKALEKKLQEFNEEDFLQSPWLNGGTNGSGEPRRSQNFFQPLGCNQTGFIEASANPSGGGNMTQNVNGFVAGWM